VGAYAVEQALEPEFEDRVEIAEGVPDRFSRFELG